MKAIFIDIDNTLLDFDAYVRESMRAGFARFGLRPYEPWMYDIFVRENDKLWQAIERSELTFARLQEIRWNTVFRALGIEADGIAFERYFREALHESAIPVPGAHELLERLHGRFLLCAASNRPIRAAGTPAGAFGHAEVFRLPLHLGENRRVQALARVLRRRLRGAERRARGADPPV